MSRHRKQWRSRVRMRPHDLAAAGWTDPYGEGHALAPTRKPPPKRSRREKIRTRAMRLARQLKVGAGDDHE